MFEGFSWVVACNSFLALLSLSVYILLNGFVIGVGMVIPFLKGRELKSTAFGTILPFWDMNATWVIYTVVAIYTTFPTLASLLFPRFYLPIMFMVFAFVLQVCAIEFRSKERPGSLGMCMMDLILCLSSVAIGVTQGVVLGGVIIGFGVGGVNALTGGISWYRIFSLLCGASVVMTYGVLGVSWLKFRLDDDLVSGVQFVFNVFVSLLMLLFLAIPVCLLYVRPEVFVFVGVSFGRFLFVFVCFVVQLMFLVLLLYNFRSSHLKVFLYFLAIVALGFLALIGSRWPYVGIGDLSVFGMSSGGYIDKLFLVLSIAILPCVFIATALVYRVFLLLGRAKVSDDRYLYR